MKEKNWLLRRATTRFDQVENIFGQIFGTNWFSRAKIEYFCNFRPGSFCGAFRWLCESACATRHLCTVGLAFPASSAPCSSGLYVFLQLLVARTILKNGHFAHIYICAQACQSRRCGMTNVIPAFSVDHYVYEKRWRHSFRRAAPRCVSLTSFYHPPLKHPRRANLISLVAETATLYNFVIPRGTRAGYSSFLWRCASLKDEGHRKCRKLGILWPP